MRKNIDELLESYQDFSLDRQQMSDVNGGYVVRLMSVTGYVFLNVDTQVYYDILGNVMDASHSDARAQ